MICRCGRRGEGQVLTRWCYPLVQRTWCLGILRNEIPPLRNLSLIAFSIYCCLLNVWFRQHSEIRYIVVAWCLRGSVKRNSPRTPWSNMVVFNRFPRILYEGGPFTGCITVSETGKVRNCTLFGDAPSSSSRILNAPSYPYQVWFNMLETSRLWASLLTSKATTSATCDSQNISSNCIMFTIHADELVNWAVSGESRKE